MSDAIVTALRCEKAGEAWRLTVSVLLGGKRHEVWYRVSSGQPIADGADTLLTATMIPAMRFSTQLRIEGAVSSRLLTQAETIQDIFHAWYRDFQKISISSHQSPAVNDRASARGVGCFFSGGVDSSYSVLKHRDEITHLILVHGFDMKLEDEVLRVRVTEKIRHVAEELGKPLIEVETNLRTLSDEYTNWGHHYFGSALASVALLLSPLLRKVYIASDDSYAYLRPWGSSPLITPLWSTDRVEIVLDGCERSRVEKVEKIISSQIVLKSLRVCWKNLNGAYNCGRCEKCLRTMVNLRAVGALERCTTFARPFDLSLVSWIDTTDETAREYAQENLDFVEQRGNDRELSEALHDALTRLHYRGLTGWPRRAYKRLHRLLGVTPRAPKTIHPLN